MTVTRSYTANWSAAGTHSVVLIDIKSTTKRFLDDALTLSDYRAELIDLVDVMLATSETRKLYSTVWTRLSEYDYGHIDEETLRRQLRELVA